MEYQCGFNTNGKILTKFRVENVVVFFAKSNCELQGMVKKLTNLKTDAG
jgi:hypothetical protein